TLALLERPGHFEQIRHGILRLLESLFVRDLLRRLEHELEFSRDFACPGLQNRGLGHAIESIVDLDRPKTLAVEMEHLLVRHILRVERALPLLIGIAAGANIEVHTGSSVTRFCVMSMAVL